MSIVRKNWLAIKDRVLKPVYRAGRDVIYPEGDLDRIANKLGTDKSRLKTLPPSHDQYRTRASIGHGYTIYYEKYFSQLRQRPIKLLEIGVLDGRSVKMWKEYFPQAEVFGLDLDPSCAKFGEDRIQIFIGDQTSPKVLDKICQSAGQPFDIIIDDGSHFVKDFIASFDHLFAHLSEGGVYVIEDVNIAKAKNWGSVAHNVGMAATQKVGNSKQEFDQFIRRVSGDNRVKRVKIYERKICFVEKR